ncbi:unnamed protein product [Spirodela intermedia]|uniref:Uncharacterized protein n=1 Tax=Spirodela intermedia TaxID=51605 RepID=A0A7I8IUD7_SPIIN|nr:unnamed protein product [Spirodela intermedia]CAA6661644.1 unnamed protein product [Spirodela intermedia]
MASARTSHEGIDIGRVWLDGEPSSSVSSRLREALTNCSKVRSAQGDRGGCRTADNIVEWSPSASENVVPREAVSEEALLEILEFLSSPTADEVGVYAFDVSSHSFADDVDALSLELPKLVVKFVGISDECRKYAERIIDYLITTCNPRDMLSMLCEASNQLERLTLMNFKLAFASRSFVFLRMNTYLSVFSLQIGLKDIMNMSSRDLYIFNALDSQIKVSTMPIDFVVLLAGLSKVILSVRRHHVQQIKVALPVVLKVTRTISSDFDGEDEVSLLDLYRAVIGIGISIQSVCDKSMGERKEELRAILGLYTIQNWSVAFLSMSNLASKVSSCISSVKELSQFLPICGLSYLGLITGDDVESINRAVWGVLWGSISEEVAKAAGELVVTLLDELRTSPTKRWQAVGMLKHLLSSTDYSWKIKAHSVELLLNIMDATVDEEQDNDCTERSFLIPALEKVMVFSADAALRKKAFSAFKKVVSDIPRLQRFDVLKALITNSSSPDMVGLLLDLVREEVNQESRRGASSSEDAPSFWSGSALELVELVLRPPKGGPLPSPRTACRYSSETHFSQAQAH